MTSKQLMRLLATLLAIAALACSVSVPVRAQAAPANTIVVDDGFDNSPCAAGSYSLRCAISYANANPGTYIRFAPGLPAVLLNSPLPTITADFTWIDGHDINNGCVCPRIDGKFMSLGNGLTINASYVTISNLTIVNIPAGADEISILGGKDIEISHSYLGIMPGATDCGSVAQTSIGIEVESDRLGSEGNDNGVAYIFANIISCHTYSGVYVGDSNYVYVGKKRDGNVSGNYIGTTSDGTRAAGNRLAGVEVSGNSDKVYVGDSRIAYTKGPGIHIRDGTADTVIDNVLSANQFGLYIRDGSTHAIIGNKIGTTPDGLQSLPNTYHGIFVDGGSGHTLWANLIAYNGAAGIAVNGPATHASIRFNDIYRNGGLPIDLGDDGPTPNGSHGSLGPDNWHPYPVVTAASGSLVQGTTCADCSVLIFQASGNPAAAGGGGKYLLSALANGSGQWSASLPGGLTRADVTFTGLDATYDNTSEMSPRPQLFLPLIVR